MRWDVYLAFIGCLVLAWTTTAHADQNVTAEDTFKSMILNLPLFTAACFPTTKQVCTKCASSKRA